MRLFWILCLALSLTCGRKSVSIKPYDQNEQITWQYINLYLDKMEEFHNGKEVPACKEFINALNQYAEARKRSVQVLDVGTTDLALIELKAQVLRTYKEWKKVHQISHKSFLDLEKQLEKLPG